MTDKSCIRCLEDIVNLFERGKENCAEQALDIHQQYIDALQYAIQKVRKDEDSN